MTPAKFQELRKELGLSVAGTARLMLISGERTVRRWERGIAKIPGPAQVLMQLLFDKVFPDLAPHRRGAGRPRKLPPPKFSPSQDVSAPAPLLDESAPAPSPPRRWFNWFKNDA